MSSTASGDIPLAALGALVVMLTPCVASAYRPFDGTDADVAQPGEFALELGPLHYARQGNEEYFLTPSVLNLGVAERLELILDFVPVYPRSGPVQVTDTDVFAKYLLRAGALQGEGGPSVAVEGGLLLPEVNAQSGLGAALTLVVSERWSSLTLHLSNEGELSRGELVFAYTANLIAELELSSPLRPVAELGFAIEPSSGSKGYSALGGLIWTVGDELALDAAARVGRVEGENSFEARLGLTWAAQIF